MEKLKKILNKDILDLKANIKEHYFGVGKNWKYKELITTLKELENFKYLLNMYERKGRMLKKTYRSSVKSVFEDVLQDKPFWESNLNPITMCATDESDGEKTIEEHKKYYMDSTQTDRKINLHQNYKLPSD